MTVYMLAGRVGQSNLRQAAIKPAIVILPEPFRRASVMLTMQAPERLTGAQECGLFTGVPAHPLCASSLPSSLRWI